MTDFTPPERIYYTPTHSQCVGSLRLTYDEPQQANSVEYIRADLVDSSLAKKALLADNKRLTEQMEAAKRQKTIEEMERALAALKAEADSSNLPKE